MNLPSSIQVLGVNPFLSRFINRKVTNKNKEKTLVLSYVKQQAASAFERSQAHHKENGSILQELITPRTLF